MMRKEGKLTFEEMIKERPIQLLKMKRSLKDQSLKNQKRRKKNQSKKKKKKLMKSKKSKEFHKLLLVFGSCL